MCAALAGLDFIETKPVLWAAKQLHFYMDFFLAAILFHSAFPCKKITDKYIKEKYVFRVRSLFLVPQQCPMNQGGLGHCY